MEAISLSSLKEAQYNVLFFHEGDEILFHISSVIKIHNGGSKIMSVEQNLNVGDIVNVFDTVDEYIDDLKDAEIVEDGDEIRKRWDQF